MLDAQLINFRNRTYFFINPPKHLFFYWCVTCISFFSSALLWISGSCDFLRNILKEKKPKFRWMTTILKPSAKPCDFLSESCFPDMTCFFSPKFVVQGLPPGRSWRGHRWGSCPCSGGWSRTRSAPSTPGSQQPWHDDLVMKQKTVCLIAHNLEHNSRCIKESVT